MERRGESSDPPRVNLKVHPYVLAFGMKSANIVEKARKALRRRDHRSNGK
jgi:hypothetical protein